MFRKWQLFSRHYIYILAIFSKIYYNGIIITLVIQIVFNILLNSVLVKNIFSQTVIQYANDNIINIKSNIDAKMSGIEAVSQNIIYDKNIYNTNIKKNDSKLFFQLIDKRYE